MGVGSYVPPKVRTVLISLFEFYVFANLHIALCALALTLTTEALLGIHLRNELLVFIFCGTFFGYNLQRLPSAFRRDPIDESFRRHYWNTRHPMVLAGVSIFAGAVFAFSFSRLYLRSQLVALLPAALSFAYALPVIPLRHRWIELREIAGIKIFIIAITWSLSCVLLPAASIHHIGDRWFSASALIWAVGCAAMIFALTIPFDIRDLGYDAFRLKTIPARLGEKRSIRLALACLLISDAAIWAVYLQFATVSFVKSLIYSLWSVIAALLICGSKPDRHEYFFSFWIDGLLLLLWASIRAA